jgi:hypothetical protein
MRALAILVSSGSFEDEKIRMYYKSLGRRKTNRDADTLAFENMMMAFHNQASLGASHFRENRVRGENREVAPEKTHHDTRRPKAPGILYGRNCRDFVPQ